jgi:hypothetical protein
VNETHPSVHSSEVSDGAIKLAESLPTMSSPFRDCLDSYGKFSLHPFNRPDDGFVDGYIKVRWSKNYRHLSHSPQYLQTKDLVKYVEPRHWYIPEPDSDVTSPDSLDNSTVAIHRQSPRLVPDQFGYMAKMDLGDRRLWDFCRF